MKLGNLETYQVQRDLIYPLLYMQERGIRVDIEAMRAESAAITVFENEKQEELNQIVGKPMNVKSFPEMTDYFYGQLKIKPFTKVVMKDGQRTSRITVDKKALIKLAAGSQGRKPVYAAKVIQDIREARDKKAKFLDVKLGADNRLRSSFGFARSGRLRSSKDIHGEGLNIQTLPPWMKKFILADEGYVIYDIDKAQAENRIVAYIAPDLNMIDAFESGRDIHRRTAAMFHNKREDEISTIKGTSLTGRLRSERDDGKDGNHALNYKESANGLAEQMQISLVKATELRNLYLSLYPGIKTYWNWVLNKLKQDQTLVNFFGRTYQFLDKVSENSISDALYFIPQSTVADIINRWGLLYVWENPDFEGFELLNQVHDSIVFQIPISLGADKHFEMVSKLISNLDQTLTWGSRSFYIPTDCKLGLGFAKMQEHKGVLGQKLDKKEFVESFKLITKES